MSTDPHNTPSSHPFDSTAHAEPHQPAGPIGSAAGAPEDGAAPGWPLGGPGEGRHERHEGGDEGGHEDGHGGGHGGGRHDGARHGQVEGLEAHAPASLVGSTARTDFPTEIFDAEQSFESLGLRSSVLKGLHEAGFQRPTKIQALLIPVMLQGKDVLGQARTGTGKTAAFGLPLLHMCNRDTPFQALVLVPTRELCLQVADDINTFGRTTPIRACAVYGGQRIRMQVDQLERNPQIIVSTPGRLMDMIERRYLHLANVRFAVLDEVDRMLDIGFRDDIRKILKMCPPPRTEGTGPGRQTVFVSATLAPEVERLARTHSHNAEKVIAVYTGALTNATVRQFYLPVAPWDKRKLLMHLLTHEEPALTVVFCRTKRTVDDLTEYLNKKGIDAHSMHGDMYQSKRNKVIEKLHAGDLSVLVASDLASRGLDIDGITHVVNYDLPEDPEVYVHRIGRTARVGRDGVAWAFVTPEQGELLTAVETLINAEIPKLDYPDFVPGPVPAHVAAMQAKGEIRAQQVGQFNRYTATVDLPIPAPAAAAPGGQGSIAGGAGVGGGGGGGGGGAAQPAAADPLKFPGGVIPTKLPPKRMFGKVKTADSMKAAMQQALKTGPGPAPGATPPPA